MIRLAVGVPLVEVERSGVVESVHTGHLVVLNPDGSVRASLGDPTQPFFPRSSNKPMQAVGLHRLGLNLESAHRAMSSSSHSGETFHINLVQQMLALGGLSEDQLGCPPDWPLGPQARDEWLLDGGRPTRTRMNCSGKHSAMLLTCQQHDWPLQGYLEPTHPLQVSLAETVADVAGEQIHAVGVDGCGAPVFALSLVAVARAFSRLAVAGPSVTRHDPTDTEFGREADGGSNSGRSEDAAEAGGKGETGRAGGPGGGDGGDVGSGETGQEGRAGGPGGGEDGEGGEGEAVVAAAMRAHPELIAGTGRSATLLMQGIPGLIAKDGAEAIYAAALPDGTALALKIDDGAQRAADRAVVAALRLVGIDAPVLDELESLPLLGGGAVVGSIRSVANPLWN